MEIPLVDLNIQHNLLKDEIDEAIKSIIESSQFIKGEKLKKFEDKFSQYCGMKYGVGTNSGTSALYLALVANGIEKGDEVITVPNTFIATASAISHCGASIKFVDIDNDDYNMDVSQIKIDDQTKCILPVHLYGHLANMSEVIKIAQENNLEIVEDCAQAHGAEFLEKKAPITGTGIFSFFPAKNLGALGDAGMVVTNELSVAEKVEKLRDHGRSKNSKYEHDIIGFNYRMDTIQAAVLLKKLNFLDEWNSQRRECVKIYNDLLESTVECPREKKGYKHVYYMYVIRAKQRDKLASYLKSKGISTGIHYPIPLHLQKSYSYLGYKKGDFPVAEKYAEEILSLPLYPGLKEEQIRYIADNIKRFYTDRN